MSPEKQSPQDELPPDIMDSVSLAYLNALLSHERLHDPEEEGALDEIERAVAGFTGRPQEEIEAYAPQIKAFMRDINDFLIDRGICEASDIYGPEHTSPPPQ